MQNPCIRNQGKKATAFLDDSQKANGGQLFFGTMKPDGTKTIVHSKEPTQRQREMYCPYKCTACGHGAKTICLWIFSCSTDASRLDNPAARHGTYVRSFAEKDSVTDTSCR